MNYQLNNTSEAVKNGKKESVWSSIKKLISLMVNEKKNLIITFFAVIVSSLMTLIAPMLIGNTIDQAITTHDYDIIMRNTLILLLVYVVGTITNYIWVV